MTRPSVVTEVSAVPRLRVALSAMATLYWPNNAQRLRRLLCSMRSREPHKKETGTGFHQSRQVYGWQTRDRENFAEPDQRFKGEGPATARCVASLRQADNA